VLPPDSFEAQTKMVMKNLKKALAAGGAKLSDVTKITIYICNPHDVPKARGILHDYFGKRPPAAHFAFCADWPTRISCWRSRRLLRCDGDALNKTTVGAAHPQPI
jgi:enamine deaminase RidA (YjgF/YER057c/UK114 family)